jgi:transcriptional regulator with XRE-family HTH domain
MARILALKEEGTHPPVEGILSKFAEIHGIPRPSGTGFLAGKRFDIVLIDASIPRADSEKLIETFQNVEWPSRPAILLLDFKESPARLRRRLNELALLGLPSAAHPPDLRRVVQLLGVSQESLARILNVSSKTVQRWLKGTRPRYKPELERLQRVANLLLETLTSEHAIRSYLNHPNPSLGGETPITLLTRGEFDRVEGDLQAVREGVYI